MLDFTDIINNIPAARSHQAECRAYWENFEKEHKDTSFRVLDTIWNEVYNFENVDQFCLFYGVSEKSYKRWRAGHSVKGLAGLKILKKSPF